MSSDNSPKRFSLKKLHYKEEYKWYTTERFHSRILVTDGSTDKPQSVFTQESWLRMGAHTHHRAFSLKSWLRMGAQTDHRAFSLKSLGYGWEHRQTTERFHSRVLVMDGSTDRPQCFPSRIWDTDVSTDHSVFSLKNHGYTCPHRPQNVFTQEPQINPLGPRPPVTAHSFSLP